MNNNTKKKKGCLSNCAGLMGGIIGVAILILVVILFGYFILRAAGAYLIIADELQPTNAIVIMGGGGEPRMAEALELFRDGLSRIIILTETGEYIEEYDYLQSFDIRIQLLNNGVPAGNILTTETEVSSTFEEAEAVLKVMQIRQMVSAIIVTDPYHTKRTSIIFNDVFLGEDIKLYFRPVTPSWYNSQTWFLTRDGWKFTMLEYIKLVAYQLGLNEYQN